MIRVIIDIAPDDQSAVVGHTMIQTSDGLKHCLYFEDHDIELAASLGGEILVTE